VKLCDRPSEVKSDCRWRFSDDAQIPAVS